VVCRDRKAKAEGGTLALFALGPNTASMSLDDVLGNGQAEPATTASAGSVTFVETLEYTWQFFFGNSDSGIGNADNNELPASLGRHCHTSAGVAKLDSVMDQIDKGLSNSVFVARSVVMVT
jgi:hypothetical protein